MIWRITTGAKTNQNDPAMKKLTQDIDKIFHIFDPTSFIALLQLKSYYFCKLTQLLGMSNIIDTGEQLDKFTEESVESVEADPMGNYISRGLAEIQKNGENMDNVFNKHEGKMYLRQHLADLFVAGMWMNLQYSLNCIC